MWRLFFLVDFVSFVSSWWVFLIGMFVVVLLDFFCMLFCFVMLFMSDKLVLLEELDSVLSFLFLVVLSGEGVLVLFVSEISLLIRCFVWILILLLKSVVIVFFSFVVIWFCWGFWLIVWSRWDICWCSGIGDFIVWILFKILGWMGSLCFKVNRIVLIVFFVFGVGSVFI